MKKLTLLSLLLVSFFFVRGQQKAELGTYQIEVPSAKYIHQIDLNDDVLEEIEENRRQHEDRTVSLENGLKVFVISRASKEKGRRIMAWKISSK